MQVQLMNISVEMLSKTSGSTMCGSWGPKWVTENGFTADTHPAACIYCKACACSRWLWPWQGVKSVPEQLLGEPLLNGCNSCLFSASPFSERAQLCCHSRGYLLDNRQQITFITATKGKDSNDAKIFQVKFQRKRKRVWIQFCSWHPVIPSIQRASSMLQSDCWGPPQVNTKPGDSKGWSDSRNSSLKDLFISPVTDPLC